MFEQLLQVMSSQFILSKFYWKLLSISLLLGLIEIYFKITWKILRKVNCKNCEMNLFLKLCRNKLIKSLNHKKEIILNNEVNRQ